MSKRFTDNNNISSVVAFVGCQFERFSRRRKYFYYYYYYATRVNEEGIIEKNEQNKPRLTTDSVRDRNFNKTTTLASPKETPSKSFFLSIYNVVQLNLTP